MKKELQEKLYEKYPKIFAQKDLPMSESALCWGCQCGDGWFDLIDTLCHDIQDYINKHKLEQVEVTTVKEKFGGLRFYIDKGFNDGLYNIIQKAEDDSYTICEHCGSEAENQKIHGWMVTLCKSCINEYKERK